MSRTRRALVGGAFLVACAGALSACGSPVGHVAAAVAPPGVVVAVPFEIAPPPPPPPAPPEPDGAPILKPVPVLVSRRVEPRPAPAPRPRSADDTLFTVEIPRIGLVARVHEGQSPSVLARGPGHLSGSAMPGPSGNVVIPGHRTVAPHPFLDIDRLEGGDKIVLVAGDARFVYEVTGTAIVSPEDGSVTDQTSDPTITLYACHPKGSNRERYVVVGRLVQALPAAQAQASQSSQPGRTDQPKPAPSCGLVPCLARGTRE